MKNFSLLFLFLFPILIQAQKSPARKIIKDIDFQQDSVKAVYDWVTNNIRYDVNKLNRIKQQKGKPQASKVKNQQARINAKIEKVLMVRQGVCEDYSYLFDAIMKEIGYESFVVTGLSKKMGSSTISKIGHAWNAVKVNGVWKLYDTTWGSGQVKDGKKFVKRYTDDWYAVPAVEMIKTHMPLDPIWQLLEHPVSYGDFKLDRFDTQTNTMDFNALIAAYLKKGRKEQMQEELERSVQMGEATTLLIRKWQNSRKRNIKGSDKVDALNQSSKNLNQAIKTFNEYISARKKRFKGKKWTLAYSKTRLKTLQKDTKVILQSLRSTRVKGDKSKRIHKKNIQNTRDFVKRIDKEIAFLESL